MRAMRVCCSSHSVSLAQLRLGGANLLLTERREVSDIAISLGLVHLAVFIAWIAKVNNEDYVRMQGLKKVATERAHRKELVTGNLQEYLATGGFESRSFTPIALHALCRVPFS